MTMTLQRASLAALYWIQAILFGLGLFVVVTPFAGLLALPFIAFMPVCPTETFVVEMPGLPVHPLVAILMVGGILMGLGWSMTLIGAKNPEAYWSSIGEHIASEWNAFWQANLIFPATYGWGRLPEQFRNAISKSISWSGILLWCLAWTIFLAHYPYILFFFVLAVYLRVMKYEKEKESSPS